MTYSHYTQTINYLEDVMEATEETKGLIYDIQHYSIHDGPGIRTLVFFKGCPLNCWWCSNPESQSGEKEVIYSSVKCIRCGKCVTVCPEKAIVWERGQYSYITREQCNLCGQCFNVCYSGGLKEVGTWYTVDKLIEEVLKDEIFFRTSGGGVTVGGGEPLYQPRFLEEFLHACSTHVVHTTVETCGYAPAGIFQRIAEITDLFLMDLKHVDEAKHTRFTGVSNSLILDNWRSLEDLKVDVVCRIPVIPGFNDTKEDIAAIGRFILEVGCKEVDLLPYHRLGEGKYASLDRIYKLEGKKPLTNELLEEFKSLLIDMKLQVQIGG